STGDKTQKGLTRVNHDICESRGSLPHDDAPLGGEHEFPLDENRGRTQLEGAGTEVLEGHGFNLVRDRAQIVYLQSRLLDLHRVDMEFRAESGVRAPD